MSQAVLGGLLAEASAVHTDVVELRRSLHRRPEVGLHLPGTQRAVLDALDGLGLDIHTGTTLTSVVAVLDGGRPGPTVLLRADMDALPLQESSGLPFASETDGVMHACGHDTHVAMLVGAARLLAARRDRIAGRVVFMFQPGEEGYHGARVMLSEGLLDHAADGAPVRAAFALHITTRYPTGTINLRSGPMLAAGDKLRIVVRGRGGHAAMPDRALDPVPVACEMALAFQTMITRQVSVFDPAVLTIGQITAGTVHNIIPESAELRGTMRTLSEETRAKVKAAVTRVAEGIAAAHGATAEVWIEDGFPVTVNDTGATTLLSAVAAELIGEDRVGRLPDPVMGSEDFSYVLQRVPGAMAFLGACPPGLDPELAPANHSNLVVFDEAALQVGTATYAAVALRSLG